MEKCMIYELLAFIAGLLTFPLAYMICAYRFIRPIKTAPYERKGVQLSPTQRQTLQGAFQPCVDLAWLNSALQRYYGILIESPAYRNRLTQSYNAKLDWVTRNGFLKTFYIYKIAAGQTGPVVNSVRVLSNQEYAELAGERVELDLVRTFTTLSIVIEVDFDGELALDAYMSFGKQKGMKVRVVLTRLKGSLLLRFPSPSHATRFEYSFLHFPAIDYRIQVRTKRNRLLIAGLNRMLDGILRKVIDRSFVFPRFSTQYIPSVVPALREVPYNYDVDRHYKDFKGFYYEYAHFMELVASMDFRIQSSKGSFVHRRSKFLVNEVKRFFKTEVRLPYSQEHIRGLQFYRNATSVQIEKFNKYCDKCTVMFNEPVVLYRFAVGANLVVFHSNLCKEFIMFRFTEILEVFYCASVMEYALTAPVIEQLFQCTVTPAAAPSSYAFKVFEEFSTNQLPLKSGEFPFATSARIKPEQLVAFLFRENFRFKVFGGVEAKTRGYSGQGSTGQEDKGTALHTAPEGSDLCQVDSSKGQIESKLEGNTIIDVLLQDASFSILEVGAHSYTLRLSDDLHLDSMHLFHEFMSLALKVYLCSRELKEIESCVHTGNKVFGRVLDISSSTVHFGIESEGNATLFFNYREVRSKSRLFVGLKVLIGPGRPFSLVAPSRAGGAVKVKVAVISAEKGIKIRYGTSQATTFYISCTTRLKKRDKHIFAFPTGPNQRFLWDVSYSFEVSRGGEKLTMNSGSCREPESIEKCTLANIEGKSGSGGLMFAAIDN